jgi:hypothetical protein
MREIFAKMDKFENILSLIFPKFVKDRVKNTVDFREMEYIADD